MGNAPKVKGTDWRAAAAAIAVDQSTEMIVDETELQPGQRGGRAKKDAAIPAGTAAKFKTLEEDDTLRFFWLDYLEQDGRLILIGKVLNRDTGKHVSACLTISGLGEKHLRLTTWEKSEGGKEEKREGRKE